MSSKLVLINRDTCDQRIDNFLIRELKGVPKSRIYRAIRNGEVRVNKGRIKSLYRLKDGDQVRIPPINVSEKKHPTEISDSLRDELAKRILHEEKGFFIINKPSGLAVHGGSGVNIGLIEALRIMRPEEKSLELVHRLDRDTSGCLIIAKQRSMLRRLHQLMREGRVNKRYQLLVKGNCPFKTKLVDIPLEAQRPTSGERMVIRSEDGKICKTQFTVKESFKGLTLLIAKLLTGRMHQIRVHAIGIGHPIVGDSKYGDKDFNLKMKKKGMDRLFLHAFEIEFTLPDNNQHIKVRAPLGEKLDNFLENLREQV